MAFFKLLTPICLTFLVSGQPPAFNEENKTELEAYNGDHRAFAIICSDSDYDGDGIVWKISADENKEEYLYALIADLDHPVNTCFDKRYELLYVCESGDGTLGKIYQYEMVWTKDDKFELASYTQTTVFDGSSPMDCAVDSQGNLFFVTADDNVYGMTTPVTSGTHWSLASAPDVQSSTGIDVRKDNEIWWSNGDNTENAGTLAEAEWTGEVSATGSAGATITAQNKDGGNAVGLAATDQGIFYTAYNHAFEWDLFQDVAIKRVKHLWAPKSISWGDKEIWIVDGVSGNLYYLKDNKSSNKAEDDDVVINIDGMKGITLINGDFAAYFAVAIAFLFL